MGFPSKSEKLSPKNAVAQSQEKIGRLSSSTLGSDSAPPPYEEVAGSSSSSPYGAFTPTTHLRIDAVGVTSTSALSTVEPIPVPVFRVQPRAPADTSVTPEYISFRIKRGSNSCALVRGPDPGSTPVNSTIYRWGPGRKPRMRFFSPGAHLSVEESIQKEDLACETVDVKNKSMFSRKQVFDTSFGQFSWRYGGRGERKEFDANNLLIMEVEGQARLTVAHFVRNEEFRTPGTNKWMAGNGGRLMLNLSMWAGAKGEESKIEAFAVASCLLMLKQEVDRMRDSGTIAIT